MARTRKDAPYRVKEKRAGMDNPHAHCPLCTNAQAGIHEDSLTGIFYAHEVKELEAFIGAATEAGYDEVKRIEVMGFLGELPREYPLQLSSDLKALQETFNAHRVLYNDARPLIDNIAYVVHGAKADLPAYRLDQLRSAYDSVYLNLLFKQNLFKIITVKKTSNYESFIHHSHFNENKGNELYYSMKCACCCSDSRPHESPTRTKSALRNLTKNFNSSDPVG